MIVSPIFMFSQMPEFGRLCDKIAGRALRGQTLEVAVDHPTLRSGDQAIGTAVADPRFTVFDTATAFCGRDTRTCEALDEGEPLLIDYGHLAPRGAQRLGKAVVARRQWNDWVESLRHSDLGHLN